MPPPDAAMPGGRSAAFPASLAPFISRAEFEAALQMIETKIENAELRNRNWFLAGCLAIILALGGGYVTIVSKLDRLTETLPQISRKLDGRTQWIQREEQWDAHQDEALQKLDPAYRTMPYKEPPE